MIFRLGNWNFSHYKVLLSCSKEFLKAEKFYEQTLNRVINEIWKVDWEGYRNRVRMFKGGGGEMGRSRRDEAWEGFEVRTVVSVFKEFLHGRIKL